MRRIHSHFDMSCIIIFYKGTYQQVEDEPLSTPLPVYCTCIIIARLRCRWIVYIRRTMWHTYNCAVMVHYICVYACVCMCVYAECQLYFKPLLFYKYI
jgi:hypothetical protein